MVGKLWFIYCSQYTLTQTQVPVIFFLLYGPCNQWWGSQALSLGLVSAALRGPTIQTIINWQKKSFVFSDH